MKVEYAQPRIWLTFKRNFSPSKDSLKCPRRDDEKLSSYLIISMEDVTCKWKACRM